MRLDMPEARDPFDSVDPKELEKRKTAEQLAREKQTKENIKKFLEDHGSEWNDDFDDSEGQCAICGSDNLDWIDSDQDDTWRSDTYSCKECGSHGVEYSEYRYTGTRSSSDDIGSLVIQVKEELGMEEE